jgi:hypothetical protein
MLSEVFWSFFITSTIGCLLATTALLYRSKCKEITCCGCKIVRDIEAEVELDERNVERQESKSPNNI